MKSKLTGFVLAALLLAGLSGCDAMFTNVFEKLAPLKTLSTSDLESMSVDEIEKYAEDDDFYNQLAEDPAKLDAVLTNLEGQFDETADTAEEQKAAALYAEILLKTSGAFDVVNNLVEATLSGALEDLVNAADTGTPDELAAAMEDLITELFGGQAPTQAEVLNMVDALADSWTAYQAIGAGLAGGAELDGSLNAGDMAFCAVVGAFMSGVEITDGSSNPVDLSVYISEVLDGDDVSGYEVAFTEPGTEENDPLYEIFNAAGIDLASLGL